MIQENSSNRQENIVAGDNSQLQFLSAVEEFKRAETDEEKAVAIEAMRIVANTGNKSAQYHMAAIYGNGDGVLMDLEEAVKWCRLAAEQGHMEAIFKLGESYYYGEMVKISCGSWTSNSFTLYGNGILRGEDTTTGLS